MKLISISKSAILAAALALAATAFAASGQKGNLLISSPAQLNGTTIPAGEYTVTWEGSGPAVTVNILSHGTVVATAPARMLELNHKSTQDAVEVKGANGGRELTALRFSGKKIQLNLGTENAASQPDSGNSIR